MNRYFVLPGGQKLLITGCTMATFEAIEWLRKTNPLRLVQCMEQVYEFQVNSHFHCTKSFGPRVRVKVLSPLEQLASEAE